MTRKLITVAAVVAIALVVTSAALSRTTAVRGKLVGTVGPGFTIKLTMNGKKVRTLKAGTYKFVIRDRSAMHNFELEKTSGTKVEKELTHVSETGTVTKKIKLARGKWKYYCKPHEDSMFGRFTVK